MAALGIPKIAALNQSGRGGLAWNIGLALFAVLLINGLIVLVNPGEMSSEGALPLSPPGYVIGIVWTALFACMGLARWNLVRSREGGSAAAIVWLALLCLAYPIYTGGLRNETIGLIGNVVTLIFTLGVIASILPRSRTAALWILPITLWLVYATFLTAVEVRSI